jgi:hypothetical protein
MVLVTRQYSHHRPEILVQKAQYLLERYQYNLVIGNLLAMRKWGDVFVGN